MEEPVRLGEDPRHGYGVCGGPAAVIRRAWITMGETAELFPGQNKANPTRPSPRQGAATRPKAPQSAQKDAVIICQDNLTFMRSLPDASMKLIVTSPYYNLGKPNETSSSLEEYVDAQKATITEAVRLLHPTGSICWQIGNYVEDGEVYPLDILLYPIFKKAELHLRNRIIWTFGHGLHCQKRLSGRYETILWFTKTEDYTFNLDHIRVPSKYPNKK